MTNPLSLLPQKVRAYFYGAFAVAVVVDGALDAAGVHDGRTPQVLAYLGGVLGLTALSNLSKAK